MYILVSGLSILDNLNRLKDMLSCIEIRTYSAHVELRSLVVMIGWLLCPSVIVRFKELLQQVQH